MMTLESGIARYSYRIPSEQMHKNIRLKDIQQQVDSAFPDADVSIAVHYDDGKMQSVEFQANAGQDFKPIVDLIKKHEVAEKDTDEAILRKKAEDKKELTNFAEWKRSVESRLAALETKK